MVIFAVKVTLAPAHAVLPGFAVILIVGSVVAFTVMVIGALTTTGVSTQGALLVSSQVTTSPLLSVVVV